MFNRAAFLHIYGISSHLYRILVYLVYIQSMGPCLWLSVCMRSYLGLTDVTLADEDANSILTDDAKRATLGNVLTKVERPGGQISNQRE